MSCYIISGLPRCCHFCFHVAIDGMSAESRCTWSRSKHPKINTQGCIYKVSYQRRQLHRSSTVWTKANGFLSSRPVIPAEPGPGVSIPRELQHRVTFGIPRHGGPSRTVPALCSETERFAMSVAHPFETEGFANLPSSSHY